ncbi:mRNA decay activator protein ZFP36L2-B-like [Palaemon carinicauda]|uniref:mRNA decay activator protein ZFP36L2-B-like n=1 Tax=Palaemon carinicauda TaxID=392227 RepID=UPI0035B5EAE6
MDTRYYPRPSNFKFPTHPNNGFSRNHRTTPPARRRLQFSSPPSPGRRGRSLSSSRNDGMRISSNPTVHLRYKTELCRAFEETGICRFGADCTFAHGFVELRAVCRHPKYKTEMCRAFHGYGFCLYGIRCHFVHSPDEFGGLSPTDEYLIRKRQIELASGAVHAETDTKPAINQVLLANLRQAFGAQQEGANIPLPRHLQHMLAQDLPVASNAAFLLMKQQCATPDPATLAAAVFLRQLGQTPLLTSPGLTSESHADTSHDRLTDASMSLSDSMDTSLARGPDSSGMSNNSFYDSPPKESLWDNERKTSIKREGNNYKPPLKCPRLPREETAAGIATAVAEAALDHSN